jgi:thymidine phosphorylase
MSFEGLDRPTTDKHSTGGVGDKITLPLAPLVAACGAAVPQLSGRGLGHTGGTLDKLESIPGWRASLSVDEITRQLRDVGAVICATTEGLAPADRKLYALRDVTGTVESIPLIASSIMSKKIAEGTAALVLDVKVGSGAFMKTVEDGGELAEACAALARDWGRACRVAVTDMSQPLGTAVGNALDVVETVELLHGRDRGRLREAALVFAAEAQVRLLGLDAGEAARRAERALDGGDALETFRRMVEAQGGDPRVVDDPAGTLPAAPVVRPITARSDGFLASVETEAIGRASADLGAGRRRKGDPIDPAVGIVFRPKIGDRVETGRELGSVHARDEDAAAACVAGVLGALAWSEEPVEPVPLVHGWYG